MATANSSASTRERLLEAACELFGAEGYDAVGIRDICDLADTNLAAISYHFHGKHELYVEAWTQAFKRTIFRHALDGGVPKGAPAIERLKGRIHALITIALDKHGADADLIAQVFSQPDRIPDSAKVELLDPIREGMRSALCGVLGADADDKQIARCLSAIDALCLGLRVNRWGWQEKHPAEGTVTPLADELEYFCLAGIVGTCERTP